MARKTKGISVSVQGSDGEFRPVDFEKLEEIIDGTQRDFSIREAAIKDDFCNYSYEIVRGIGLGDLHGVKGKGIVEDDMRNAFQQFNVHLACIDDVFKHSNIEIDDIDKMHDHELTFLFNVTGFKIKGSKENESIVLIGTKYVSAAGGRIELETPRIPLDSLSSYKWYNELKTAADKARLEVELYKEGKYTAVEPEEPEDKFTQTKLTFEQPAELEGSHDDFENAMV